MVRLHHFLTIAVHFPLDLPGVEGSLFLSGVPSLHLSEHTAKSTLEERHVTNRRDGNSPFYQTLSLVRRLVEEREVMVEVPEMELYSLLDQIDVLRDKVTGMLPSDSETSTPTTQPESQSQSDPAGQSSQEPQTPSSTVVGGAFLETSETESQGPPGQSASVNPAQSSTAEIDEESLDLPEESLDLPEESLDSPEESGSASSTQSSTEGSVELTEEPLDLPEESATASYTQTSTEQTEELGPTSSAQDLIEQIEGVSLDLPKESGSPSSTQGSTEQAEEGFQNSSEEPGPTSSTQNFTAPTEEKLQGTPGESNPLSSTQDSTEQTEDPSAGVTHCQAARQVSDPNPLRRDYNCATGTSATIDALEQVSSAMTPPILSDLNQGVRTSSTMAGAEGSPQITTPASLPAPMDVVLGAGSASAEQTAFEEFQQFSTTVLTSTNTRESTVTMTTTRTRFLYLPLPSVKTPLGAGLMTNTTATPNLKIGDTSETPSMRTPVMRVLNSNTTADGAPLSGFKTLSKPTTSVGEGTF
ncbi:putative mucin-5AC [Ilyonectria robusta]